MYYLDTLQPARAEPLLREALRLTRGDRTARGEAPLAAVVLKPGATVGAEALRSWVNERVGARYQQVHDVIILQEFPRNAAGKTLKRIMRDEYWKGRAAPI